MAAAAAALLRGTTMNGNTSRLRKLDGLAEQSEPQNQVSFVGTLSWPGVPFTSVDCSDRGIFCCLEHKHIQHAKLFDTGFLCGLCDGTGLHGCCPGPLQQRWP